MANITKRGNTYLIRVSAGCDINGKPITKRKTWTPPKDMSPKRADKEVELQAALFEEEVRTGQIADGSVKFAVFAERWFRDYADTQLRPRTVARYHELMNRINPVIGHLSMKSITPVHLMAFYRQLGEVHQTGKYYCKQNLKALLKKMHMTKDALSQQSGVSLTTLTAVFNGKNVDQSSAQKIADALKKPFASLFESAYDGKPLASKTILHYHRLISSIMATAVKWQVILSNPCDRVAPPKAGKTKIQALDTDEAIHLLELLDGVPMQYRTAVTVLLFTGMRRGELLGLEWRDINFAKGTISITRSSLYLPDRGTFEDETKNNSSDRVIRAPQAVMEILKEYKRWQLEHQLAHMDIWQDSGKLFTAADGSPMHPDVLSGWFHEFIKTTDLPQIHLHSLRHPYVKRKTKNFTNPFGTGTERFSQHPVLSLGAS